MNFKHLYYFWMTVRGGGVMRAGVRLNVTPQTLIGQTTRLEERLGCKLLERSGRNVRPTSAGRVAAAYADRISGRGRQLKEELKREANAGHTAALKVGVGASVPVAMAYRVLEPFAYERSWPGIECVEANDAALFAELDAAQVDIVLTSNPCTDRRASHWVHGSLGRYELAVFASPELCMIHGDSFPACIDGMPMLMPAPASGLRTRIDEWLSRLAIRPVITAAPNDWSVIMVAAQYGAGAFVAPAALEDDLLREYGVKRVGHLDDCSEFLYAIARPAPACHPWAMRIIDAARARPLIPDTHVVSHVSCLPVLKAANRSGSRGGQ
jgi:LysR family transcriptional regulator, transcriptional activator of nhaA